MGSGAESFVDKGLEHDIGENPTQFVHMHTAGLSTGFHYHKVLASAGGIEVIHSFAPTIVMMIFI